MAEQKEVRWLEYCPACERRHLVKPGKCSTCNVYDVPIPVSDKVYNKCDANYQCDGCLAYNDHLR